MKKSVIREQIKIMLQEINPLEDIDESTNLLTDFLDSMGIILLINSLEEQYKIEIPLDKIEISDFSNIDSIVSFVCSLKEKK